MRPYPKPERSKKKKTGEYEFFIELYGDGSKFVSAVTGKRINYPPGSDKFHWCFAHLLGKGAYPEQRKNPDNVVFLTPHEHFLFDHCSEKQREDYCKVAGGTWSFVYRMRDRMKRSLLIK